MSSALARDGVVLRDVHTAIGRRHFQQDLAQRDLRRRRELGAMLIVVGARLFVADADLVHDLDTLNLRHEHLTLEIPAQVGHRETFLLQRFLEARLVFEVVGLPDVLDDLRELLIAQRVA